MSVVVLLAIGSRLYREGIARIIDARPGLRVADAVADAETAEVRLSALLDVPQVLVLEYALRGSLEQANRTLARHAQLGVLMLGVPDDEADLLASAAAGCGALGSQASEDDLIDAIRTTANGGLLCRPSTARALALQRSAAVSRSDDRLTAREEEIARLIASGLPNRDIGRQLHICVSTVKAHVSHILEKLDARNRTHVAALLHEGAGVRACAQRSDFGPTTKERVA